MRTELEERGISVGLLYTLDAYTNLRGGLNTSKAREARGNLDLTLSFDTEKLGFWEGGELFVYGQWGHGDGISEKHVGEIQLVSNIDDRDFNQISEVWYWHSLPGEWLHVKVGKQDANADFASFGYCGNFVNSSFCYPPNLVLPTFPDPALGVAVFADPADPFRIGAGIYDGASRGGTTGFDTTFDGVGGNFAIGQLDYYFPGGSNELTGTYRLGAWRHSGDFEVISAAAVPEERSENHGAFFVADQLLHRTENEDGTEGGLSAFVQYSWAPPDRNEIVHYMGGGLSWKGLFPGRHRDLTGVGAARAVLSNRIRELENRKQETVIEAFHMFELMPGLTVQPDLQFIIDPGGDGRNALVIGARVMVAF